MGKRVPQIISEKTNYDNEIPREPFPREPFSLHISYNVRVWGYNVLLEVDDPVNYVYIVALSTCAITTSCKN